jgi:hypothetical protein
MSVRSRYVTGILALVVLAFGYAFVQGRAERPGPRRPAQPALIARPSIPETRLPSAREILDGAALLSLTAAQWTHLRALDATWSREAGRRQDELDAAMAEFSRFMTEAQRTRRTSLQEIQRRSAEISALSAVLSERRRLHGDAAAALLTEWQRRKLAEVPRSVTTGGR